MLLVVTHGQAKIQHYKQLDDSCDIVNHEKQTKRLTYGRNLLDVVADAAGLMPLL